MAKQLKMCGKPLKLELLLPPGNRMRIPRVMT